MAFFPESYMIFKDSQCLPLCSKYFLCWEFCCRLRFESHLSLSLVKRTPNSFGSASFVYLSQWFMSDACLECFFCQPFQIFSVDLPLRNDSCYTANSLFSFYVYCWIMLWWHTLFSDVVSILECSLIKLWSESSVFALVMLLVKFTFWGGNHVQRKVISGWFSPLTRS